MGLGGVAPSFGACPKGGVLANEATEGCARRSPGAADVKKVLIARDTPGPRAGAGTSSPIAQLVRALH